MSSCNGVNLILLDPGELTDAGNVRLSGGRADHLRTVLRIAPGHEVRVGVLDGPRGVGTVVSVDDDAIDLRCTFEETVPARPAVDLLLALPRPKVMRRLWAQIAALGVGQIILTNAERVERDYFDTHLLTVEGYRPLLIEGLQQARDTRVPCVSIHRRFKVLIEDVLDGLFPGGCRLVAHPGVDASTADVTRRTGERVLLAIGPEGGWNDFELTLLDAHGFQAIGIGPRTLRSDTACVAILAITHEACRPV